MVADEFLIQLKMVQKVTAASNLKAAGILFNKKSSKAVINKTAEPAKSDFITDAMKHFVYLLGKVLRHTGLSSDVIKRLAAVDPYIMFKRPTD